MQSPVRTQWAVLPDGFQKFCVIGADLPAAFPASPSLTPLIIPPAVSRTTGHFPHLQFPLASVQSLGWPKGSNPVRGWGDCCLLFNAGLCCLGAQRRLAQQANHMECIKVFPTFSFTFFLVPLKPEITDTCENKPSLAASLPVHSLYLCFSHLL